MHPQVADNNGPRAGVQAGVQPGVVWITLVAAALGLAACGASSPPPKAIDIRGSWTMVAVADAIQYPQTMTVTSEDSTTGKFSGTDVGAGLNFTVTGSLSGKSAVFVITGTGYTANATATISESAPTLTMDGTFTDSNHRTGTLTAKRTSS